MQSKLIHSMSVAAAAATLAGLCVPAQAVSLAGSSDLNSTGGFSFSEDTEVMFTFLQSQGEYLSSFGVYDASKNSLQTLISEVQSSDNGSENDWQGTCGISVVSCEASYTFEAGVNYFFGLAANAATTVFSGTEYNNQLPFLFTNDSADDSTVLIAVNDSDTSDSDYNDFRISASSVKSVPEPGTLGALVTVGALSLMGIRRKRVNT
ncbi:MAG: PEP-CTERM sorting domain-containing protein [Microcoleus sp. SIO2G3]|nr:PEP-CTERM sorting domain-containing protein [Microcoleus sp. SIO2G3]